MPTTLDSATSLSDEKAKLEIKISSQKKKIDSLVNKVMKLENKFLKQERKILDLEKQNESLKETIKNMPTSLNVNFVKPDRHDDPPK